MNKLWYFILIIIYLTLCRSANSQYFPNDQHFINSINKIKFIPPEDGEPPDTRGAGTRNPENFQCNHKFDPTVNEQEIKVKAIMPDSNYGLTTQKHPKIFVDLTGTSAKQVVLSIRDLSERYEQLTFFPIESEAEITGFSIPKDKPGLRENKNYLWQIVLVCGDRLDVNNPIISG